MYMEEKKSRGFLCKLSITTFPLDDAIKTPLATIF